MTDMTLITCTIGGRSNKFLEQIYIGILKRNYYIKRYYFLKSSSICNQKYLKRSPTPHRPSYSHFPLPTQTSWTNPTHSPTPQEICPVHMDRWLWTNISETKNLSHLTTYPPQAGHSSTPASVHHCHRPYR